MSASLVGSEMCIRDSGLTGCPGRGRARGRRCGCRLDCRTCHGRGCRLLGHEGLATLPGGRLRRPAVPPR
eukprot:6067314-Alexandrium_andersonii.AAC.1